MLNHLKYNKSFDQLSYDEKTLLEEAKKSIEEFVEQSAEISDVNYATRNVHSKAHAVLKGEFHINPDLQEDIKYIFDKENYEITARISNANFKISRKQNPFPAYGFAFKIKDDAGRTIANYPLVNFPLLPINSVSVFLKLFTNINRFYIKKIKSIIPLLFSAYHVVPSIFNLSFLRYFFRFVKKRNDFILSHNFYSVGAYRFDDKMVKIKLKPQNTPRKFLKKSNKRKQIRSFLKDNEYKADVLIKICYNIKYQPINKLHKEWKNTATIKIGEVKFDKNSVQNPSLCENELLSFNPFESLDIFRPVGKIQKLREIAYKVSFQTRRKMNLLMKYK